MLEYINEHQAGFWIALGFLLLGLEIVIFGFTTIVLFFAGLGAITAGLLMKMSVLDVTWTAGIACFGISTGIYSVLLWKPFKRIQNKGVAPQPESSDMIGLEFIIEDDITALNTGTTKYSGIFWKVEIGKDTGVDVLKKGQRVTVTSVAVGVFGVKAVSTSE